MGAIMEVLRKNRSFLTKFAIATMLLSNISIHAAGETETSNNFFGSTWNLIKVGAIAGLSVAGYITLSKISKRPLLSMAATTALSIFVAHKLTNSQVQRRLEEVRNDVRNNGNLIEQAKDFLNEKIENVRTFFNERFNKQDTDLTDIKNDVTYIKNNMITKTKHKNLN